MRRRWAKIGFACAEVSARDCRPVGVAGEEVSWKVMLTGKRVTLLDRQVSEEEGKELARSLKAAWIEVSARHGQNVGEYIVSSPDLCDHGMLRASLSASSAKVFELMLQETERETQETGKEPEPSKCTVM